MDLLTLLPYLEVYGRMIVSTNKGEAISYRGMSTVTINTEDTYNNVNQICILHDTNKDLYLYVNYATRRSRAKYKLTNINSIAIT